MTQAEAPGPGELERIGRISLTPKGADRRMKAAST